MALTTADARIPADKNAESLELIGGSQDNVLAKLGNVGDGDLVAGDQSDDSSDSEQPQTSDQQQFQPDDPSQTPAPDAQQQN